MEKKSMHYGVQDLQTMIARAKSLENRIVNFEREISKLLFGVDVSVTPLQSRLSDSVTVAFGADVSVTPMVHKRLSDSVMMIESVARRLAAGVSNVSVDDRRWSAEKGEDGLGSGCR